MGPLFSTFDYLPSLAQMRSALFTGGRYLKSGLLIGGRIGGAIGVQNIAATALAGTALLSRRHASRLDARREVLIPELVKLDNISRKISPWKSCDYYPQLEDKDIHFVFSQLRELPCLEKEKAVISSMESTVRYNISKWKLDFSTALDLYLSEVKKNVEENIMKEFNNRDLIDPIVREFECVAEHAKTQPFSTTPLVKVDQHIRNTPTFSLGPNQPLDQLRAARRGAKQFSTLWFPEEFYSLEAAVNVNSCKISESWKNQLAEIQQQIESEITRLGKLIYPTEQDGEIKRHSDYSPIFNENRAAGWRWKLLSKVMGSAAVVGCSLTLYPHLQPIISRYRPLFEPKLRLVWSVVKNHPISITTYVGSALAVEKTRRVHKEHSRMGEEKFIAPWVAASVSLCLIGLTLNFGLARLNWAKRPVWLA